jgi:hypothetical protein
MVQSRSPDPVTSLLFRNRFCNVSRAHSRSANLYYDVHNTRTQEVLQHNTLGMQSVLYSHTAMYDGSKNNCVYPFEAPLTPGCYPGFMYRGRPRARRTVEPRGKQALAWALGHLRALAGPNHPLVKTWSTTFAALGAPYWLCTIKRVRGFVGKSCVCPHAL